VLLNNDVKLAEGCVDHLVESLESDPDCFLAGPQCWGFDGQYEGTHSALCFRRGLVHTRLQPLQGTGRDRDRPYTASAGAVLAVDRTKFLELGGFDPLFLPGHYEDLDLAFRGWLRGWTAVYVPQAVAYHKRSATFDRRFGSAEISRLDVRNSLLFAWKNLKEPSYLIRHLYYLVLRVLWAILLGQSGFLAGVASAVRKLPSAMASRAEVGGRVRSERELFGMLPYLVGE
jgi:GT2 family glycosyltransferase